MRKISSTVHPLPDVAKSSATNGTSTPKSHRSRQNDADKQLTLPGVGDERPDACGRIHVRVNGCGIRSGLEMAATPSLGIVRGYDDLLDVARARMTELSITFETLDSLSGVCSGYSAKLLGPNPSKRLGAMSFAAIMGALGIQLLAVEDAAALDRIRSRLVPRKQRRSESHWRHRGFVRRSAPTVGRPARKPNPRPS